MPRRLNSSTVKRASPGRSIRSGPAIRSGSRGLKNPAMGPRASGGITRVSSRQCTASDPSDSSTRNESKLLRTDQSIELPMRDATSLAESTTESGPVTRLSRSTLVCVLASALGVGAPTPVSATGGSWVECGPNTCAARRMIGSGNHQTTSAATKATARSASRSSPLRQPFTVSHVIHRTSGLRRALYEIERAHERCLGELEPAEGRLEAGEGDGAGVPRRATERDVGAEGPRFRGKPERREFLLHAVLQDLELGLRRDAHPHDAGPLEVGKHAEPAERERQGARPRRRARERRRELRLPLVRHVTQKLERQMDSLNSSHLVISYAVFCLKKKKKNKQQAI